MLSRSHIVLMGSLDMEAIWQHTAALSPLGQGALPLEQKPSLMDMVGGQRLSEQSTTKCAYSVPTLTKKMSPSKDVQMRRSLKTEHWLWDSSDIRRPKWTYSQIKIKFQITKTYFNHDLLCTWGLSSDPWNYFFFLLTQPVLCKLHYAYKSWILLKCKVWLRSVRGLKF